MKRIARIVSIVLHPVLMPLYVLFFIFNGRSLFAYIPFGVQVYCYWVTAFAFLIMPLLALPLLKRLKLIRDYKLAEKQEKAYPILVAVIFAFLGFWFLGHIAYTHVIRQLYLVAVILLSVFSVITFRWKISMHMTAIGGVCGFLLAWGLKFHADVRGPFVLFLFLAGILASSRLCLNKHTPFQVYAGFLLGLFFVLGILA